MHGGVVTLLLFRYIANSRLANHAQLKSGWDASNVNTTLAEGEESELQKAKESLFGKVQR